MRDWQADFAVFSADGQLAAIVEAKKKANVDSDWAAEWFNNYLGHQRSPGPPFVLLVTPEKLYVWKRPAEPALCQPTAVADARHLFISYLDRDPANLSGGTFEFIVGAWLNAFANHLWQPSTPDEIRAFVDTGLLEAVENGRVVADVAA